MFHDDFPRDQNDFPFMLLNTLKTRRLEFIFLLQTPGTGDGRRTSDLSLNRRDTSQISGMVLLVRFPSFKDLTLLHSCTGNNDVPYVPS